MTQQSRRRLLWAWNVAATVGVLLAVAGALLPLEDRARAAQAPAAATTQIAHAGTPLPAKAYAVISGRDLRAPLHDAPPPTIVATQPAALPSIRLTGTVTEPGFSYGMFRTPAGDTKMLGAGESYEGMEIVEVNPQSVKVKFNGQLLTLPVQKEPATP